MRFVVKNVNVLPTSIVITDMIHGGKESRSILPGQTVEIEFSIFRAGLTNWSFAIDTRSQSFLVFWQAFSFVPSKSQELELEQGVSSEDLAGFATEEEALAASDETSSSEWTEQALDENESDAPERPERFDAFGAERDSEWGAESGEELTESLDEAEDPEAEDVGQNEHANTRAHPTSRHTRLGRPSTARMVLACDGSRPRAPRWAGRRRRWSPSR